MVEVFAVQYKVWSILFSWRNLGKIVVKTCDLYLVYACILIHVYAEVYYFQK